VRQVHNETGRLGITVLSDNLIIFSPLRQKQYTKYKRIKNYKTQPETVSRQTYTMLSDKTKIKTKH